SKGDQQSLQDGVPLFIDKPLDRQLELATRERALNALRDNGYPYAQVFLQERDVAPRRRQVVVTASPGILAHFGEIEISGPKTVSEKIVERQLLYEQGDVFSRTK